MAEDIDILDVRPPATEEERRKLAIKRLQDKREFQSHLMAYLLVNLLLVGIWWVTGHGFFWPIFPLLGWGIGIGMHAWTVYGQRPPSEEEIRREMDRLHA